MIAPIERSWSAPIHVAGGRHVRVRPWRGDDGKVYFVDFEVLASRNMQTANDLEIRGKVKWDGCSDWRSEGSGTHTCEVEEVAHIAACLRAAYALAHDLITDPDFDRPDFAPEERGARPVVHVPKRASR